MRPSTESQREKFRQEILTFRQGVDSFPYRELRSVSLEQEGSPYRASGNAVRKLMLLFGDSFYNSMDSDIKGSLLSIANTEQEYEELVPLLGQALLDFRNRVEASEKHYYETIKKDPEAEFKYPLPSSANWVIRFQFIIQQYMNPNFPDTQVGLAAYGNMVRNIQTLSKTVWAWANKNPPEGEQENPYALLKSELSVSAHAKRRSDTPLASPTLFQRPKVPAIQLSRFSRQLLNRTTGNAASPHGAAPLNEESKDEEKAFGGNKPT